MCSYLCIYLANFGGTLGVTFLGAWIGHRHHLLPHGLSSLLKPASLCQGLETLGTDIQKLFSLESIPTTFDRSPEVLRQAGALPVRQVLPLVLPGCREWGTVIAPRFLCGQVSPQPTPNPRSLSGAAACTAAGALWDAQAGFGGITHGWTDQGTQLLSRMHRDQKTDVCGGLNVLPKSQEMSRLAHGKGCWLLLQSPAASSRIQPHPELSLLPGSSLRAGGGSCAAGSKLGVVCAPWMSLQAGKLFLVPTTSLPQGWDKSPCPPQFPRARSVPPDAAGPHATAFPWQRVLPSLCFRVSSELEGTCL